MKKIFIIACEPSGDSHGAHLVEELKKLSPGIEFTGLGGPKMAAAGVRLLEDMTKISALGLGDVLRLYFTYRKIFYRALREVAMFKPDAIVGIDSPAFNLRFAKKIKKRFPFIYYIAPQIWAWGGRRIHTIKKTVSKMLVILPFEKEIYDKAGVPCEFVGHPLLDSLETGKARTALRAGLGIQSDERAVGILPGSRENEVKRILPLMLESARLLKKKMPETVFFLAPSPNVSRGVYDEILRIEKGTGSAETVPFLDIRYSEKSMHDTVSAMDFAFVTSGTATLETALLGTPFFLFYKASWTTYVLGRQLIRVKFLGLVNLLAGKSVVPEFIQNDIHPETIANEAEVLLKNAELYEGMKQEFQNVRKLLGSSGASLRAAQAVLNVMPLVQSAVRSGTAP